MHNIHIFHHSDPDGYVSAGVVKLFFKEAKSTNIFTHAVNYLEHDKQLEIIDESNLHPEDSVYILDFSFDPDIMEKLASEHEDCIWIDHHITAITKMEGIDIKGKRKVGDAGCLLTWNWFYPKEEPPVFLAIVHMFDVWINDNKQRWNNIIRPFVYGLECHEWDFESDDNIWDKLFNNTTDTALVQDIIREGKTIMTYEKKRSEHLSNKCAFVTLMEGARAITMNTPDTGSDAFDGTYNPEEHDIMMSFSLTKDGMWAISMYSDKAEFHVGSIAKKFGGGGHAGAAGCRCAELPFKLPTPD